MSSRRLAWTWTCAMLIACAFSMPATAAAQSSLEYTVKANYLVRFAAFVEWPAQAFERPDSPLRLCVAGRNPFGAVLARAAAGQTAHGRAILVVTNVTRATGRGCHILYLGAGADPTLAASASMAGLLTVSDAAVSPRTGAIHFVVQSSRVRFHINSAAARREGLSISSRLLALALTVVES